MGIRSAGLESYETAFFEHIWDEVQVHTIIGTLGHDPGIQIRNQALPDAYALIEKTALIIGRFGYVERKDLVSASIPSIWYGLSFWEQPHVLEALGERPGNAPLSEILEYVL